MPPPPRTGWLPCDGSQPSQIANARISNCPTQNSGSAYPAVASVRTARSSAPPARRAESTPSATPSTLANSSAVPVSSSVAPSRPRISASTGCRLAKE